MFNRTCQICGAEFKVSLLRCLTVSLAGFAVGWLIGLPDETMNAILSNNPGIAVLLMSRKTSALFLGIGAPAMVFNSKVCPKCSAVKSI
ncbi:MAG: hypothetical protein PHD82_15870 [Candidatus Riflebacteria bacterium]|nr:hypothetical protein [Candidatus Riflebacteria bacterium]